MTEFPIAILATDVPPRKIKSVYPEPFASMMAGRTKIPLGEFFGMTSFGVNLTKLGRRVRVLRCYTNILCSKNLFISYREILFDNRSR